MAEKSADQQQHIRITERYLWALEVFESLPEAVEKRGYYADLMRSGGGHLKVLRIDRGRVTCLLTVTPAITNVYNTMHGGAVAGVAEEVALACVRTVAGDNKEFFLGEAATSYLSAARLNAEVEVHGCIVRKGRSVVVSTVEFRMKKTRQLLYTFRATFYNMPAASL